MWFWPIIYGHLVSRDCLFVGGEEETGGILVAEEAFYQGENNLCKKQSLRVVVAVYHATIVAIEHGLLKKCWPIVISFNL